MKCWDKNEINMGIDTIELMIETDKPLRVNGENVNVLDLICKKTKRKVGTIKHKKGRRKGYCLNINLPKCKYEDNKKTFGKEDSSDLPKIYKMIKNKLDSLFGEGFYKVEVLACEVSATAKLDNYKNVDAILNMIKLMLLQDGKSFCVWVHGKKYNSKDCHNEKLITKEQVESIKTKCSNNRYSVHLYNKGLEQGCIEQGLLRIEFRYNSSGLNYAKTGNTIESFLTASSLEKIIKVFRKDYKKYFIHRYWSDKNGNKFYEKCIEDILQSLEKTKKPSMAVLLNKEIAEIDIRIVEKAFERYYSNTNSCNKAIKRIREKGNIEINKNVINDFVQISRTIIKG